MLASAVEQAELGRNEGGIPIGAAVFRHDGSLVSAGRDLVMVTTLAPCWYCTGLIRQFGFRTVVIGESFNFAGGVSSLRERGIRVVDLASRHCVELLATYIREHPAIWNEDIGEHSDVSTP